MKNFKIALLAMISIVAISCNNDDDADEALTGSGEISVTFDNGYEGNDLILATANTANANGEALTVTRLNYIVSNFVLTDVDGNEYVYPKDDSYFIISQESDLEDISLSDIPAGEYTTIKFGIGIDDEKFQQGADGQGDLWTQAEAYNLTWSWTSGYKYINYEGTFTSETVTEETNFRIHLGRLGDQVNYEEVTLALPTNVTVSDEMDSNIHLKIDASKILTSINNLSLSEEATYMTDPATAPLVAENTATMFTVDHVHNGSDH
ncbi:MbnP family protein [Cellulophaga sp. L1A9]|uniref:MbnP family protein n=1 Tax=Cellulophaga sp. L1A9 TaxID=2686362 RepID=UPI00131E1C51|nr:MbnP family protein [Cellulophaga sp. L1A9]